MDIISHKEAKSLGLMYYFTGVACPSGHISKRVTKKYECYECIQARRARNRARFADTTSTIKKRYLGQQNGTRYARTPEEKEKRRIYQKEYRRKLRESNGGKGLYVPVEALDPERLDRRRARSCAENSIRRGAKIPDGMTIKQIIAETIHLFKVKRELEEKTGIQHFIDHILPIMAGGMHEVSNLQVLSEHDHNRKTHKDKEKYMKRRYRTSNSQLAILSTG